MPLDLSQWSAVAADPTFTSKWSNATDEEKRDAKSWKELEDEFGEQLRARFDLDTSQDTVEEEEHEWLCTFGDDVFIMDDMEIVSSLLPHALMM